MLHDFPYKMPLSKGNYHIIDIILLKDDDVYLDIILCVYLHMNDDDVHDVDGDDDEDVDDDDEEEEEEDEDEDDNEDDEEE